MWPFVCCGIDLNFLKKKIISKLDLSIHDLNGQIFISLCSLANIPRANAQAGGMPAECVDCATGMGCGFHRPRLEQGAFVMPGGVVAPREALELCGAVACL